MYDLNIIKRNGGSYIDSREVAELIGKAHKNLLRDIAGYIGYMRNSNRLKIEPVRYFLESEYLDAKGETRPCYLLSKMGCEMVANKLTGEKGVLFTAVYVAKFNEMEAAERAAASVVRSPRLGEYNAAARLIVHAMQNMGATAELVIGFLKGIYEPLGFTVMTDELADIPQMYTAKQIAKMHGIYSITGKPHSQAVSAILNENLFIGEKHKTVMTMDYGDYIVASVRYDSHAAQAVKDWITEYDFPSEIYGFDRTYRVIYQS